MTVAEKIAMMVVGAVLVVLLSSTAVDMLCFYKKSTRYEMPVYQTALLTTIVSGTVYYVFRRGTKS